MFSVLSESFDFGGRNLSAGEASCTGATSGPETVIAWFRRRILAVTGSSPEMARLDCAGGQVQHCARPARL